MIERDRHFLAMFLNDPVYVVEEPESPELPEEKEIAIQFKGKNKQEIVVMVNDEKAEYLSENEEAFLMKILQAVQLTQDDIALVNAYHFQSEVHQPEALNNIPYKTLITFGDLPEAVFFRKYLTKYLWNKDDKNRVYLQADALKEIANDRTKKQLLWKNLQEIFT
jgi:hypothetical protein